MFHNEVKLTFIKKNCSSSNIVLKTLITEEKLKIKKIKTRYHYETTNYSIFIYVKYFYLYFFSLNDKNEYQYSSIESQAQCSTSFRDITKHKDTMQPLFYFSTSKK